MGIPDYQTLMLPLLELCSDKKEYFLHEAEDKLAIEFKLTEKERKEPVFRNRIGWAKTYLSKAGLIQATKRAQPDKRRGRTQKA